VVKTSNIKQSRNTNRKIINCSNKPDQGSFIHYNDKSENVNYNYSFNNSHIGVHEKDTTGIENYNSDNDNTWTSSRNTSIVGQSNITGSFARDVLNPNKSVATKRDKMQPKLAFEANRDLGQNVENTHIKKEIHFDSHSKENKNSYLSNIKVNKDISRRFLNVEYNLNQK